MIIINSADSAKFELNGIEYPRNFICIKQGSDSIAIHNAYDTRHQLLGSTKYYQVTVDDVIYSNQSDLMSALATVLFAKNVFIENPDTVPSTTASLEEKITIVNGDAAIIGDSSDGGKIKKTAWFNVWDNYLKGKVNTLLATFKSDNFLDFTSSGQIQLNSKIPLSQKGFANGVATLGADAKIPSNQINFGSLSGTVAEGDKFIQLSGTDDGKRITGSLEFDTSAVGNNGIYTEFTDENGDDAPFLSYVSLISALNNGGVRLESQNNYNSNNGTIFLNSLGAYVSGNGDFVGLIGEQYFNPVSGNSYVQKTYVDSVGNTLNDSIDLKIPLSQKAAANGVATLGADSKIPNNQLPALAITETFPVASQAAMLALSTAEQGDVCIRTDLNKSFILSQTPSSTLANWKELLTPTDSVTSVDGQVGVVNLSGLYTSFNYVDNKAFLKSLPQGSKFNTDLPSTYPTGISSVFANQDVSNGFPNNYGSILTVRSFDAVEGGTLQIAGGYSLGELSDNLKWRFSNNSTNNWGNWKNLANDTDVVHKTGNENIFGYKYFSNGVIGFASSGDSIALISNTSNILGSGSSIDLNTYVYGNNPYSIWTNGSKRFSIAGNGDASFTHTVSGADGTASNHFVTKAQLDLKSNDSDVVHKTGNEFVDGTKTFTGTYTKFLLDGNDANSNGFIQSTANYLAFGTLNDKPLKLYSSGMPIANVDSNGMIVSNKVGVQGSESGGMYIQNVGSAASSILRKLSTSWYGDTFDYNVYRGDSGDISKASFSYNGQDVVTIGSSGLLKSNGLIYNYGNYVTTDLNDIRTAGFYLVDGANRPTSTDIYFLTVESNQGTSAHQTATSYGVGSEPKGIIYSRVYGGSVWSDWEKIVVESVANGKYFDKNYLIVKTSTNANTIGEGTKTEYLSGSNQPTGTTDGSLFTMAYSDFYVNQMFADWRTNKWFTRSKDGSTWLNWKELAHTDSFNGIYVPTSGNTTIAGTKTFSSSPIIPNATASNHALSAGQADGLYQPIYENTEWVTLSHSLPASYSDVVLQYKIKDNHYIIDFKATCTGTAVVGIDDNYLVSSNLPNIDSEKLRKIVLDNFEESSNAGLLSFRLISSGEPETGVDLYCNLRDTSVGGTQFRAILPILKM